MLRQLFTKSILMKAQKRNTYLKIKVYYRKQFYKVFNNLNEGLLVEG